MERLTGAGTEAEKREPHQPQYIDRCPARAGQRTIQAADIREWRTHDVVDPKGHRIGMHEAVSVDTTTDEPAVVTVRTGLPTRRRLVFVPLDDALLGPGYVKIAGNWWLLAAVVAGAGGLWLMVTDSPSEGAKGRSASAFEASPGNPNAARASARCSARSSPDVLGTPTGGIRLRIPSPVRRKACEKTAAPVVALVLTTAAPMIVPVTPSKDASTAPTTVASALATTCTAVRSSTLRFGARASSSLRFSIDVP